MRTPEDLEPHAINELSTESSLAKIPAQLLADQSSSNFEYSELNRPIEEARTDLGPSMTLIQCKLVWMVTRLVRISKRRLQCELEGRAF